MSVIFLDPLPKWNRLSSVFRVLNIRALGAHTRNVDFVGTGFTGRTDSILVWNSATNNGLPSSNRFRFQGNVINNNCIRESLCNVFGGTFFFIVSFPFAIEFLAPIDFLLVILFSSCGDIELIICSVPIVICFLSPGFPSLPSRNLVLKKKMEDECLLPAVFVLTRRLKKRGEILPWYGLPLCVSRGIFRTSGAPYPCECTR
jgi:hypothetical protein